MVKKLLSVTGTSVTYCLLQHYIELSSQYVRHPPVYYYTDDELGGLLAGGSRPASVHVARQQSMESGVCMSASRRASSDVDTSPCGYQRPVRSSSRDDTPLLLSQMCTDAGYLRPTSVTTAQQQLSQSRHYSVSATSDSDLCGSIESDVFPCSTSV